MNSSKHPQLLLILFALLVCGWITGCPQPPASTTGNQNGAAASGENSPTHDDLPSVTEKLAELNETVVATLADPASYGDAHEALHEVGTLLEKVQSLSQTSGLSEDTQGMINDAVQNLLVGYGQFDEQLHGSEDEFDAEALATQLDESMEILQEIVAME